MQGIKEIEEHLISISLTTIASKLNYVVLKMLVLPAV